LNELATTAFSPTVLLHGIDDTSDLFSRLRPFLEKHGREVHAPDLVPNNGTAGLEALAQQIAAYIDETLPNRRVDLVGFSMGGIVARYYVQRLGGLRRVNHLITVASPHRGTWTAYLRRNPGGRQMRPGSAFLRDLSQDLGNLKILSFTSIWSPFDLMIIPATSSVVREAQSITVPVVAHALMMRDRRVLAQVERALADQSQRS
jgi:triacylglycerol lipase